MVDDGQHELGVLLGAREAPRERDTGRQRRPEFVGDSGKHRGINDAGRDCVDANAVLRKVSGCREGEADDSRLGGSVRGLANLSLIGGDGGSVDNYSSLSVLVAFGLRYGLGGERENVEGADQVDLDDRGVELQVMCLLAEDAHGGANAGAVDQGAKRGTGTRPSHGGPHLIGFGHVRFDVLDSCHCGGVIDARLQVEDKDVSAVVGQCFGARGAEPGGSSCDDGGGVVELHQFFSPFLLVIGLRVSLPRARLITIR